MSRRLLVGLGVLSVVLMAAPASADEPPALVRIRAHSEGNRLEVRIGKRNQYDETEVVCGSALLQVADRKPGAVRRPFRDARWEDCVADVAPGTQLYVRLGEIRDVQVIVVPADVGPDVELLVLPAEHTSQWRSGVALVVVGGIATGVGLGGVALLSPEGYFHNGDAAVVFGVVLALGAATLAGGIVSLSSRSHQPRVELDVAKPREVSSLVPPPFTPVGYGFSF